MANLRSSVKRLKIALRNRVQNQYYLARSRAAVKRYIEAADTFHRTAELADKEKAKVQLNKVFSWTDKMVRNNIIHSKTAARNKARHLAYLRKFSLKLKVPR